MMSSIRTQITGSNRSARVTRRRVPLRLLTAFAFTLWVIPAAANDVSVLAFLNSDATTFDSLDDDVRLDARAARALIRHRNGEDGLLGTRDDDLFDALAEVDSVPWVGSATMSRLVGYVNTTNEDASATVSSAYDGVLFTSAQAAGLLGLVNTASAQVLDELLDRRAVVSITDARPIYSLGELAGLPHVGHAALLRLRGATTR